MEETDTDEMRNLAQDPVHAAELQRLNQILRTWARNTKDPAIQPPDCRSGEKSCIEFHAAANLLSLMEDPAPKRIQKWNSIRWVGWIWLIGFLGMMAEEVASGIMSLKRLPDALFGSAIGSPFMLLVTIPVGALGLLVGSWRLFRRFQIHLSLLLPILLCAISPVSIAWDRVFPGRRFERFTGVAFPMNAQVENCTFDDGGGLFGDRGYEFHFTDPRAMSLIFMHKFTNAKGVLHTSLGRRPRAGTAAICEGQRSVPYRVTVRGGGSSGPLALPISGRNQPRPAA